MTFSRSPSNRFKILGLAVVVTVLAAFLLARTTFAQETRSSDLHALQSAQRRVAANRMVEFVFTSEKAYHDPFNEVELAAVFRTPKGRELRVPAFWTGGQTWKVRYASPVIGLHTFRTESSDENNRRLNGATGRLEVVPYQGDNPLYRHGPICVAGDHRHFAHADGTPFFWLGDTWWMGLCQRLRWPEDFRVLTADRKQKGFNVVQIVAGLYPDMPAFDPRGANETGLPWENNYARIRPAYFDQADRRLQYLADEGIVPCVVGAWGYHLPWLGTTRMKQHWRYLVARYGALPVVWCAAGETNMPWYRSSDGPGDEKMQKSGWAEVCRSIHKADAFNHPLTLHPACQVSTRACMNDASVVDFELLQTGHGMHEIIAPSGEQISSVRNTRPPVPVIAGEPAYENLNGQIPADVCRALFWVCLAHGAAGHTYGANGIWQVNRPEQPYGASPGGNNWGTIPWLDAMRLPGSAQVAFGKQLLTQYEWWRFEPHAEWAAYAGESRVSLDGCSWIWYPEGNPARNAPAEKRYFRRTFVIPAGKEIAQSRLGVSADDAFTASLNGQGIGDAEDWRIVRQFDVARHLKAGTNVLAIAAENKPATCPENPAGLIASLEIHFTDGNVLRLKSDAQWRCAKVKSPGWDSTGFDDAACDKALAVAHYGDSAWGRIRSGNRLGPQAFGIPGGVRVIYVPQNSPISVRDLGPRARCSVTYLDPVTGRKSKLGGVHADATGTWACPPPSGCDHDWVVVLESNNKHQF
jgi:hypothetical protein